MPYYSTTTPSSGNATQLQGRAVSPTGPSPGAVLTFVGSGAAGTWVPGLGTPGPQGPAGLDGQRIYSTTGAPPSNLGASGDYCLDRSGGQLYGPKSSGDWGTPIQLQSGPQGPTGERGPTGGAGGAGPTGPAGGPTGQRGPTGERGPTGVTVHGIGTTLRAVNSAASLVKLDTNEWLLAGDLA